MIKVGIAGTRGLSTLMGLSSIEDVKITAMCDLDEEHLRTAADRIQGEVKTFRVFDDMLEKGDNHSHTHAVPRAPGDSGSGGW